MAMRGGGSRRHPSADQGCPSAKDEDDLIAIDEVGYLPLVEAAGAGLLFQVIAGRAEMAALMLTRKLPSCERTQLIPTARLCKALIERIIDRVHIIETGTESYRFRRTLEMRGGRVSKGTGGGRDGHG